MTQRVPAWFENKKGDRFHDRPDVNYFECILISASQRNLLLLCSHRSVQTLSLLHLHGSKA